jgi:hypothetical protein
MRINALTILSWGWKWKIFNLIVKPNDHAIPLLKSGGAAIK